MKIFIITLFLLELEQKISNSNIREFSSELTKIEKSKKNLYQNRKYLNDNLKKMMAIKIANSHQDDPIFERLIKKKTTELEKNKLYVEENLNQLILKEEFIRKVISSLEERKKDKINFKPVHWPMLNNRNPVDKYVQLSRENNGGINFFYNTPSEIKCMEDGVVIFVDDLTSFGKLLMVEYGNELKSIYLGNIQTKVEKGDLVKKNDVLGILEVNKEKIVNKLYYELRVGEKIIPMNLQLANKN